MAGGEQTGDNNPKGFNECVSQEQLQAIVECYGAGRIERREPRVATAAGALQYPRRYSTAGTVHG